MSLNVNFQGKKAIVTGAGRGIGRGVSKRLHELGAKVVAVSRSLPQLEELAAECPGITIVQVDLADWKLTQEKLKDHVDDVDYLVNNAAVSCVVPVGDIDEESIKRLFAVNYNACVNLTQMVIKGMRDRRFGSIVNVSSIATSGAFDGHCIYGSTKIALDMLTKTCAHEYGQYNVRINSINPTVVWTEMGKAFWSEESKNKVIMAKIPMGRFVQVHEIVDPVIFLLSDHAAMINGASVPIDGGLSARG